MQLSKKRCSPFYERKLFLETRGCFFFTKLDTQKNNLFSFEVGEALEVKTNSA
jgi:hypothetical protein